MDQFRALGLPAAKTLESDEYEGFIRTAKTNTRTHFGATYKTVPRHVLKARDDGKPDVLCGIDLVTDLVWASTLCAK